ncbi:MAG: hypothetical protein H6Q66_2386 [Firmicutes bacterium]|nr:hypothetical protein [Bacillota bacterium]
MTNLSHVFDDAHIFRMTDDTGMFQHTCYNVPDLDKGYTTDDNARALIMAVMLYEKKREPKYLALVYRYLAFTLYAQNANGHFRNFMTYGRQFTETQGSEECFGRCLWALGYTLASPAMPAGVKAACTSAVSRALPQVYFLKYLRGQAYALIGLSFGEGRENDSLILKLAASIAMHFEQCAGAKNWNWFEDRLTYDNALLPWAMFVAFQKTRQERFHSIACESMTFFDQAAFRDGFFRPVGCNGWWVRGKEPALCDQQPVEASMSTLAHLAAFAITGEQAMLELARKSFAWYSGENSLGESLIDPDTGGCFDGITASGVNRNQGAESIVGYGIAKLALEKYRLTLSDYGPRVVEENMR